MEQNETKRTSNNVFKRLKTTNENKKSLTKEAKIL